MTHDEPQSDGNELIAESDPLWEIDASCGQPANGASRVSTAEPASTAIELQIAVQAAVEELPDPERQILRIIVRRLMAGDRLEIEAIATESGLPYITVYERAVKAMTLLHNRLSRDPAFQTYLEQHKPELELEPLGFVERLLRSA